MSNWGPGGARSSSSGLKFLDPSPQITGTEYVFYNDTKVVFLSPAVPEEPEAYNLTALIQMDGHRALLRTEAGAFEYVADPTFENFTGGVKKQVNKLIHARVRRPTAWGPGPGRGLLLIILTSAPPRPPPPPTPL